MSDWPKSNGVSLDLYVPVVAADVKPIRVSSRGPFRTRLVARPEPVTSEPALYRRLDF